MASSNYNPITYQTIERDWRGRRALYLIETGRAMEIVNERWLANFGPDHPTREKRAREIIRSAETKIFGRDFDANSQTSAWDCARETENRKQIGRAAMRKRWSHV